VEITISGVVGVTVGASVALTSGVDVLLAIVLAGSVSLVTGVVTPAAGDATMPVETSDVAVGAGLVLTQEATKILMATNIAAINQNLCSLNIPNLPP
jgi:hypothetical protein